MFWRHQEGYVIKWLLIRAWTCDTCCSYSSLGFVKVAVHSGSLTAAEFTWDATWTRSVPVRLPIRQLLSSRNHFYAMATLHQVEHRTPSVTRVHARTKDDGHGRSP